MLEKYIMSCFTKLFLINDMRKINEWINKDVLINDTHILPLKSTLLIIFVITV